MQNKFFESKTFGALILVVVGLVVIVFVFMLGVYVGAKRADFSFKWAEEYHRNFGGPQGGFFSNMMGQEFTDANGVFGQIIKIDASASSGQTILSINGKDNVEKIVLASDKTTIRVLMKNEKLSDLNVGDSIVVMGEPTSSGQIDAELIRVIPKF
jgi:hypothetical protein